MSGQPKDYLVQVHCSLLLILYTAPAHNTHPSSHHPHTATSFAVAKVSKTGRNTRRTASPKHHLSRHRRYAATATPTPSMLSKARTPLLVVHREFWPEELQLTFRKDTTPAGTNKISCKDCGKRKRGKRTCASSARNSPTT